MINSCFKILEDKMLSLEELINDVQKENWSCYYFKHDIENSNPYSQYVLARGQFCFDSIEFNTMCGDAIRLYNKNNSNGHFLSIGSNTDKKDNQVVYIHKEKMLNMTYDFTGISYTVHFADTNKTVRFGASKEGDNDK